MASGFKKAQPRQGRLAYDTSHLNFNYYGMIIMNTKKALIIDIKATDNTPYAHATQIAWNVISIAKGTSQSFEVINPSYHIGGHSMLLRPRRRIQPEALAVCGIDPAAVRERDVPDFDFVIPRFIQSNDCEYVICHNAQRTIQLLKNAGVQDHDIERIKFICITSLARQHIKLDNYSTPTLYAMHSPATAHRDLQNYYSGLFDPLFLRTIYRQLKIEMGLIDFECAYQKSIDPNFATAAYRVDAAQAEADGSDVDTRVLQEA